MSMFKWDVVDPAPGEAVAPHQRLAWGKTVGLGAQHVVAMFGATFVFPIIMGLDPNLAIMFSGLCTILFLLIVSNKVPNVVGQATRVAVEFTLPKDVNEAWIRAYHGRSAGEIRWDAFRLSEKNDYLEAVSYFDGTTAASAYYTAWLDAIEALLAARDLT